MSAILTIFRRDFSRMLHSNVVATIIVLFLIMTGAMFFLDYFKEIQALNLRAFFSQAPLLLSIFCPALTMSSIAGERYHKTLDLLETMPVSTWQIVAGKFAACLLLLSLVLLFTFSYPLTISSLGALDWGPVIGGYAALILVGGLYLSIGIFASAFASDVISSFLIAFFCCFVFTYAHQVSLYASGDTATLLQYISVNTHFANIARGVIDIRDILYLLTVQLLMLSGAVLKIDYEKHPTALPSKSAECE